MRSHASDSSAQILAEKHLISALSAELGVPVYSGTVSGLDDASANLDGYSSEHRILAEAFARHGKLKPAQKRKIAMDVLKLVVVERALGGSWRKFLCFADRDACAHLSGASWLAHAIRRYGIEIRVFALPPTVRADVLEAQQRQVMVNR